jgi:hypothetical protein
LQRWLGLAKQEKGDGHCTPSTLLLLLLLLLLLRVTPLVLANCKLNNQLPVLSCNPLFSECCTSLQRWLGLAKQDKGDKPAYVAFKYYVEPKDKKVNMRD